MQAVVTAPRAAQTHNLHRANHPEAVSAWLSCSRGSEHSTPLVSFSAGPAASFGLRWSRCPCRSLRTNSWPRRCSSRSSSLSLIRRASLARGRLWHPRRQHRPLRTGLASGDRCTGRRFGARRMYVPGILSSQPSQACLPSHGTVPERRANVQKGARLSGRRPKVFGAVTRLGWRRRRYALACLASRNGHSGQTNVLCMVEPPARHARFAKFGLHTLCRRCLSLIFHPSTRCASSRRRRATAASLRLLGTHGRLAGRADGLSQYASRQGEAARCGLHKRSPRTTSAWDC